MMMSRSLRLMFSVALFLVLCGVVLVANQPQRAAVAQPAVAAASAVQQPAASSARCGRCGDGQCVKSCGETAVSCPIDCGGVPSESREPAR